MVHKYRVEVEVTYKLSIPVEAHNEDAAFASLEKYFAKTDDYEITNRSSKRNIDIKDLQPIYE